MSETQKGWSVAIQRDDGSEFLCANRMGELPPVWQWSRKVAIKHCNDLIDQDFKARVVRVMFSEPRIIK